MTHNNRSVAENLRKTVRKLKDQLEAIQNIVNDGSFWEDDWSDAVQKIRKILEGEE